MQKKTFELRSELIRQNAIDHINKLQINPSNPFYLDCREETRTLAQNRKMWAVLHDVAEQVTWYGNKYNEDEWKQLITAFVKQSETEESQKWAPSLSGEGRVWFGDSTRKMTVKRMIDVIEAGMWFGTEHSVKWSDEAKQAAEWAKRWGDKKNG